MTDKHGVPLVTLSDLARGVRFLEATVPDTAQVAIRRDTDGHVHELLAVATDAAGGTVVAAYCLTTGEHQTVRGDGE